MKRLALLVFGALLALMPRPAYAVPREIIIPRHGEKADSYALCATGIARSHALANFYLGKGAAQSLFAPGDPPAAILAITLHTLELATPATATWSFPVTNYSVVPPKQSNVDLDRQTQVAAHDVLTNTVYNGKVVVMVWEHKHIANKALEKSSKGAVTLRQLLHLDVFGSKVPTTWNGDNYDYFWIADYANGSDVPVSFRSVKQIFPIPYQDVPSNDWGVPDNLPPNNGCLKIP
jgi:hypothetical protein